ncbi:MAG: hypothetical protein HFH68_02735 [Lachnospiraceae bacterium]|nr:hypothetical protein [Lachnospiraceae bacterium]
MNKNRNGKIIWGLFFIIFAIYVIISRYICFPHINIFRLLITVFFVLMLLEGLRRVDFFEILFSIACICILYSRHLRITAITPFPILIAALFGSIGLTMIFGKRNRPYIWNNNMYKNSSGQSDEQSNEENIFYKNSFGSAVKYVNSANFHGAELNNSFGSMVIHFDNAIIQGNSAYINIENSFGETQLYIPKEWKIQKNLQRTFGSVNENGMASGTSNVTLYINGETTFGEIRIFYI